MATLVPRIYQGFRGVDFRGEEINLMRSPDSVNMWKDYKETDSIRTRPGMKQIPTFVGSRITGIHFYGDYLVVEVGNWGLYCLGNDPEKLEYHQISSYQGKTPSKSVTFTHPNKLVGDCLYILNGRLYLEWMPTFRNTIDPTWQVNIASGYIPTTSIGRKPSGGGTPYEDVNLISDYRINTFVADGTSKEFYLDAQNIDTDETPEVKVNGTRNYDFSVDTTKGSITFDTAPPAPATDGQDNVSILYKKTIEGYRERIDHCTIMQVFDNRIFVSGNPEYPNMVWHSSLNDPTYFSDLDYYQDGSDKAKITGMVAGNNALWVFREGSSANTNIFYHTPTIDDQYGKIYPSTHSSVSLGCKGGAINFNDDIVFFSQRGMEGISGDVTTEQVASHRSTAVDRKLMAEEDYENMVLVEWNGYLCCFIGNKGYIADSRAKYTHEDHMEYEWFYWEMEHEIICAQVHKGVLYLGTDDGIYTLTDMEADVESYWVTPKDKFEYPHKLKTTSKRGCVAEATGDISVHVKTDKTDFEQVGTYTNVKDYFVSRIKMKKFKDLQLKFASSTRFSLESVTLEAFVGGYIKR